MRVAIMQPTFNPWIGYFDLIDSVDTFVFLDTVQLEKRSWQTRNKIKVNNQEFMVTIPLKKENSRDETTIEMANILDTKWVDKLLKTLQTSYKKATYFEEVFPFISELLRTDEKVLSRYNANFIKEVSQKIGIQTTFTTASKLQNLEGKKDDLLLSICKELQATHYLSPQGSSGYLVENKAGEKFIQENTKLYYHHYTHPDYQQVGKMFISHLGIIDVLFNVGFINALETICEGHQPDIYFKDLA